MSINDHTRVTVIHCPHGLAIPTRCERCVAEIDDSFRNLHWEPGSLTTHALDRVLIDALADMWRDCYRGGNSEWQRRAFRQHLTQLIRHATGDEGVI